MNDKLVKKCLLPPEESSPLRELIASQGEYFASLLLVDQVLKAISVVAEEIKRELETLFPWIKQGVNAEPWHNFWEGLKNA